MPQVFGFLAYFTFDGIIFVFEDYASHPSVTSTALSYQPSVRFPAITVCNHNRYAHSLPLKIAKTFCTSSSTELTVNFIKKGSTA